jgi:pyridoxine 5'-phosphate synthase PdxJ
VRLLTEDITWTAVADNVAARVEGCTELNEEVGAAIETGHGVGIRNLEVLRQRSSSEALEGGG